VSVFCNGATLVTLLVALEKFVCQVVNKFGNLLPMPFVFALIVIDRILMTSKELPDGTTLPIDSTLRSG
jgi:hypothetical protein